MKKNLLILGFVIACFNIINAQTWEAVSDSPFRSDHSIGFSLNGIGYSVAGTVQGVASDQFYSYDPLSDTWTQLDDFPGPGRGFSIGDTYDGKAYIGFGVSPNNMVLDDLWVFDPDTGTWTELASCPCTPRFHPAFVAREGKIFVGMGGSDNGNLNDWWAYDIATDTWEQRADFPGEVRHHPYQFAVGDFVYAGLGHGNSNPGLNIFNDWYRYDPIANFWIPMADLPAEGRVAGTQFSYGGKGYVLSGDGDNHSFMNTGEFWEYDPQVNSWTELPPHPGTSRWAPTSFVIDDYVYFMTGLTQSLVADLTVWRYLLDDTPPTSTKDITNSELFISPNPTSDILNIKLEETFIKNISLINVSGQLVLEKNGINNNTVTLNVQELPLGVYFVKVETEHEVLSQKIVKE